MIYLIWNLHVNVVYVRIVYLLQILVIKLLILLDYSINLLGLAGSIMLCIKAF